jgi:hypothetical protein
LRYPRPASGGSSSVYLNRLLASQRYKRLAKRWQRYEKQLPGQQVQIDVKFVEPLSTAARPAAGRRTKHYQFTAIDDCTRLRVLRIYPRCDQKTAIQFVDYVLERLPARIFVWGAFPPWWRHFAGTMSARVGNLVETMNRLGSRLAASVVVCGSAAAPLPSRSQRMRITPRRLMTKSRCKPTSETVTK